MSALLLLFIVIIPTTGSALFAKKGKVAVVAKTPGAVIYIDSKRSGITGDDGQAILELSKGKHSIQIIKSGTEWAEYVAKRTIEVFPNSLINYQLELKASPTKKLLDKLSNSPELMSEVLISYVLSLEANPKDRADLQVEIIDNLAINNEIAIAIMFSKKLDDYRKAEAYTKIAATLVKKDKKKAEQLLTNAIILADEQRKPYYQYLLLKEIAFVLLNNGELLKGIEIVDKAIQAFRKDKKKTGESNIIPIAFVEEIIANLIEGGELTLGADMYSKYIPDPKDDYTTHLYWKSARKAYLNMEVVEATHFVVDSREKYKLPNSSLTKIELRDSVLFGSCINRSNPEINKLLDCANMIESVTGKSKSFAKLAMGIVLNDGDLTLAARLLSQSYDIAKKVSDRIKRDDIYMTIAPVFAALGKKKEAIKIANKITEDRIKNKAFQVISYAILHPTSPYDDKPSVVINLAKQRNLTDKEKIDLLNMISVYYAEDGDYKKAISIAKTIKSDDIRDEALSEIAGILFKNNKNSMAYKTIRKMKDKSFVEYIATDLIDSGRAEDAIEIIRTFLESDGVISYWEISQWFLEKGELSKAMYVASRAPSDESSHVFWINNIKEEMAKKQAENGKILKALDIANSMMEDRFADLSRQDALAKIAGLNNAGLSKINQEEISAITSAFMRQSGATQIESILNQ